MIKSEVLTNRNMEIITEADPKMKGPKIHWASIPQFLMFNGCSKLCSFIVSCSESRKLRCNPPNKPQVEVEVQYFFPPPQTNI